MKNHNHRSLIREANLPDDDRSEGISSPGSNLKGKLCTQVYKQAAAQVSVQIDGQVSWRVDGQVYFKVFDQNYSQVLINIQNELNG